LIGRTGARWAQAARVFAPTAQSGQPRKERP
jgi:hypothetical protein